ncbi:MAG: T9SS type A sorting domain-containing protein, partial [Bacteroidales bacterium]
ALYKSGETKLVTTEFTAKTTDIEAQASVSKLNFYPNPVKDVLYIDGEYSSLEIYNSMGALVQTANGSSKIDMTNLQSGVYFIKAYHNGKISTDKIVVK